jgi:hypothetical protein
MVIYFCIEMLCSCWNKHCKIFILHRIWIILNKHTYICFGELPNNDRHNDSWYSGNSICNSHQSSLNRH